MIKIKKKKKKEKKKKENNYKNCLLHLSKSGPVLKC